MVKPPCVLFLFDWRPVFWSTREEYFRQLAERLRERGITPVLVASELKDPEVRRRFVDAGARIEICSYLDGKIRYWRHIRRLQQEFSVQLAHVRFFDYFAAVHWICWLAGARTILFTEANSGVSEARGWRKMLLQLRTSVMCWPVSHHIGISEFIRNRLQRVGIPQDRISRVYNGVDTTAFVRDTLAREELRGQMGAIRETVVLIFAATLVDWKRPGIALQVTAELVRRGRPVQLWMAGTGNLREQLVEQTAQLRIADQVKWLGYQKDPQRWMSAADLLIHTAVGEAFGNVFIEAMSCGLPVVASRHGSAPELVTEGAGRLVSIGPEEVAGLADAVIALTSDSEQLGTSSRAAIQHSKRFTTEASVAGTLAVYDTLFASSALSGRR